MTERQHSTAASLPISALWQWLGVALTHAAARKRVPYIEPLLTEAEVIIHKNNTITVEFCDGSVIQVKLMEIGAAPLGGMILPIFT